MENNVILLGVLGYVTFIGLIIFIGNIKRV